MRTNSSKPVHGGVPLDARSSVRQATRGQLQKGTSRLLHLERATRVCAAPGARNVIEGGHKGTARRGTALIAALVLLVSACSGSNGADSSVPPPTSEPTDTSTSTAEPTATSAPTTAPTTTSTTEPPPDESAFAAVWEEAWRIAADPNSTEADLANVASQDVAARLKALIQGSAERMITNYAVVSAPGADGFVEINDCVLSQPPFAGGAAGWYSGRVGPGDDGTIRIVELQAVAPAGCVPAELADAAIADYEDYWDAAVEYWVPADPSSPRIAETTTGVHYDTILGLVTEHAANGWELRGRPETHPEVFEFRSPTELVIGDCQLVDPERGVYVTATGERIDLIPPIVEGQRDARSAVMLFEDGRWKVSDRQGQENFDCEFAPTPLGVPVVGEETT